MQNRRASSAGGAGEGSTASAGRAGWWVVLLAVLVLVPGCYMYTATDPVTLQPGEEIRVEIGSDASYIAAPGFMGPRRVEGRFSSLTADSLAMSIWLGAASPVTPFEGFFQEIQIARSQVALIENRQFSRGRTALASAAGLAVIAYLIHSLEMTEPDDEGNGDNGEIPTPPKGLQVRIRF